MYVFLLIQSWEDVPRNSSDYVLGNLQMVFSLAAVCHFSSWNVRRGLTIKLFFKDTADVGSAFCVVNK